MGLHAYCIVPAHHPLRDDCRGLGDVRIRAVSAGRLDLWVSDHAAPLVGSAEAARIHDTVVRAAMTQQVTPVPLRFGQSFPDDAAAAEGVTADAARWLGLLERFAGRAEYGIRVLTTGQNAERDVHTAGVESGMEYMAALARKQARATGRRSSADRIHAGIASRIAGMSVEERIEHHTAGDLLVSIAHLVAWRDAAEYHEALDGVRDVWPETQILFTGPWPPYSFVE